MQKGAVQWGYWKVGLGNSAQDLSAPDHVKSGLWYMCVGGGFTWSGTFRSALARLLTQSLHCGAFKLDPATLLQFGCGDDFYLIRLQTPSGVA